MGSIFGGGDWGLYWEGGIGVYIWRGDWGLYLEGGIGVYIGMGPLGSIKNSKTVEKIIQNLKTAKEFNRNWRLHAKLSKPINFLILVIKTVIDPIQWWIILRSVEVHNCRSDWRGTGSQIGKNENHIRYQIQKAISIFNENCKPNSKKWKICRPK